jgi:hypothetical protein
MKISHVFFDVGGVLGTGGWMPGSGPGGPSSLGSIRRTTSGVTPKSTKCGKMGT